MSKMVVNNIPEPKIESFNRLTTCLGSGNGFVGSKFGSGFCGKHATHQIKQFI
jgi:hypothetical protein